MSRGKLSGNSGRGCSPCKILAAIIALLMLSVLFVTMLPGLIFGGFTQALSPADPNHPILNSSTAILENTNLICDTVEAILEEALDAEIAQIRRNFNASQADQMEIVNPYATTMLFNANELVSMYCASQDADFEILSLEHLAQILRNNSHLLYDYTVTEEYRPLPTEETIPSDSSEDAVTEEDTAPTEDTLPSTVPQELWRIYTVSFTGESYFANQIFHLTPEQEELAAAYGENLNLFLLDSSFAGSVNPAFGRDTAIDISGFVSPATKNNLDLVQWAQEAYRHHWGYVWGTYGQVFDLSLYEYKLDQYPDQVGSYSAFIERNWLGGRTADCVGLIKGYGWLDPDTLTFQYGSNRMPDIDANSMYESSLENGSIQSIPEIPGLGVWSNGHVGIYIGNGEVIEARGTRYGVVKTQLTERSWVRWFKIRYITYLEDGQETIREGGMHEQ